MSEHISHATLKTLLEEQDGLPNFTEQDEHVSQCRRCTETLDVLQNTVTIGGKTSAKSSSSHPSHDTISEMLAKTYDNSLKPEDAAGFVAHLKSCPLCYELLGVVVEQSLAPVPANVEAILHEHADISLADIILEKVPPITARPVPPKKIKKPWIEKLLDFVPVPIPVPVAAVMLAFILFVGVPSGVYVVFFQQEGSVLASFDDHVPHEYTSPGVSFRGGEPTQTESVLQRQFSSKFKQAISDYMIREYEKAIPEFERLEPIVQSLLTGHDSVNYKNIRDYYFYRGVSHLALAQSKVRSLTEQQRVGHIDKAIEFLAEAESIARSHNLDELERERFFLGLTYGLGGNHGRAIELLNEIYFDNSTYKEEIIELIDMWSP